MLQNRELIINRSPRAKTRDGIIMTLNISRIIIIALDGEHIRTYGAAEQKRILRSSEAKRADATSHHHRISSSISMNTDALYVVTDEKYIARDISYFPRPSPCHMARIASGHRHWRARIIILLCAARRAHMRASESASDTFWHYHHIIFARHAALQRHRGPHERSGAASSIFMRGEKSAARRWILHRYRNRIEIFHIHAQNIYQYIFPHMRIINIITLACSIYTRAHQTSHHHNITQRTRIFMQCAADDIDEYNFISEA